MPRGAEEHPRNVITDCEREETFSFPVEGVGVVIENDQIYSSFALVTSAIIGTIPAATKGTRLQVIGYINRENVHGAAAEESE